ncbi:MAG TPA: hypothetical protein VLA52_04870, partial [Thermohalobaculum sp.]|nr:hypothetical protein [Thermohalobaculum sp.]
WKGYAQVYKGWILARKGRGSEAVEVAERGMAGLSSTRTALDHPLAACCLAEAYGGDGRHDDVIGALDDAIASAERTDERWFEAEIHRLRAQWILTHGGDEAEAEAERLFHKSIGTARRQGARLWELRAATDLARLWGRQGERSRAFDLLAPLHGWFTEGLGTPDLTDAEALLRDLA